MNWIFYIAKRYFRSKRKNKGLTPSMLSIAGIAVGVMTLITVLAVMNGFQLGFIEDILEIGSYHLRIDDPEESFNTDTANLIRELDGVRTIIPFKEVQTMGKGSFSDFETCIIRGIATNAESLDTGLISQLNIKKGMFSLIESGSIILGSRLALKLNVTIGDTVSLVSMTGKSFNFLTPSNRDFSVKGIFESGDSNYDSSLGFISLKDAESIASDKDKLIWGVKLDNRFNDLVYQRKIEGISGSEYDVVSWREYNRSFFGALRTEKLIMMVLIGLIFIVVGVNIFNSLKRSVFERREEIAVLRSLGASSLGIKAVFVMDGVIIGFAGAITGLLLGLLLSEHVNTLFLFTESIVNTIVFFLNSLAAGNATADFALFSPAYFYINEVPSRILFSEALFIFIFAFLSSVGAAFAASMRISGIIPAEILRNE